MAGVEAWPHSAVEAEPRQPREGVYSRQWPRESCEMAYRDGPGRAVSLTLTGDELKEDGAPETPQFWERRAGAGVHCTDPFLAAAPDRFPKTKK